MFRTINAGPAPRPPGAPGHGRRGFAPARWLALSLALGACAPEYTYAPPATLEGRQCAQQCQGAQSRCRGVQTQIAAAAGQQCEANAGAELAQCAAASEAKYAQCQQLASVEYTACLRYAPNRDACVRPTCVQEVCLARSCYRAADYGACDSEFRGCFQTCGGVIGILK